MSTATKKTNNKPAAKTETAITKTKDVALAQRPDFAEEAKPQQLDRDELILPRIDVAQALSPQIDPDNEAFIDGLKPGDLFNTASGTIYGRSLQFVSVAYRKEFCLFRDRQLGGGFGGAFPTAEEAQEAIEAKSGEQGWESMLSLSNLIIVLTDDGELRDVAYLSCMRTKLKPARKMNTYLQMVRAARYATVFELASVKEDGQKGSYYNISIRPQGWLGNRDTYEEAARLAESMGENISIANASNASNAGHTEF